MQPQYRQYTPQHPPPRAPGGHGHVVPQRRGGIGPMMTAGPPGHHQHQMPITQAQINQQHHQQQQATHLAKLRSRKPTDKALPDGVEETLTGDGDVAAAYKNLRDFERRLDATMTRKRLDIVDSLTRNTKRYRTMRIWISNTVEDQFWQQSSLNNDSFDFTANLDASYRVKIEGRLLDDEYDLDADESDDDAQEGGAQKEADSDDKMETDTPSKAKAAAPPKRHRLSHFFKALTVDFERPRSGRVPADTTVEWKKPDRTPAGNPPAMADFDEFTFKRNSDENLNITINLFRHEDPERFLLSPELAEIVDRNEASRQEVLLALWDYIKLMGLQEDEEKRNFRYEAFHKSPQPTIYDIRVTVDDPLRTQKLLPFIQNPSYAASLKEVTLLDDQLATLVQAISNSAAKHNFLKGMADDPVGWWKD
ncbi:SWI/SNF and RSC complex subunit Ssr3 [Collariella sp. IMI 366227]|nr:SWI/SNF and RSC complex subunit Ssr3 [Collariella sp. IMI 366227]